MHRERGVTMTTALRILGYYTIAVLLLTIVVPLLTSITGDRDLPWQATVTVLAVLPIMALALMVLLEARGRVSRTALWSCAGYTAVVALFLAGLWCTPPLDPAAVVLASLCLPVAAFAGLALVALKKGVL